MRYATIYASLFCLWPILAFLGGQGFSALLALTALPAAAFARRLKPGPITIALAALVVWIALSELWSPTASNLISGSLATGDFAVKSSGLRLALTALAGAAALGALFTAEASPSRLPMRLIAGVLFAQFLLIMTILFFREALLELFDPLSDKRFEALQNVIRNMNAFALALPLLLSWFLYSRDISLNRAFIAGAVTVAALAAFLGSSADSAVLMPFAAMAAILVVRLFPASGFKALFSALGAYILCAPLLALLLSKTTAGLGVVLPGSFQSRLWGWEVVLGKIAERPLIGHGLGASKTWREVYAEHPEKLALMEPHWAQYPLVPGHPHNMALHLWAETGFVGAALAAALLVLIGFKLPAPMELSRRVGAAIAGTAGAALILFSFAYSAWNEAFWASLALLAGAIVLMARERSTSESSHA